MNTIIFPLNRDSSSVAALVLAASLFGGCAWAGPLESLPPPQTPASPDGGMVALGWDPYVTFSGYLDGGLRQTQFFENHHDAALLSWDVRTEFWLPPFRNKFAWGPYLRLAGIVASEDEPWENSWQGLPGVGMQIYPFSFESIDAKKGRLLGPFRVFAEYNRQDYWSDENSWRPDEQWRFGMDYYGAFNVNNYEKWLWVDTWHGAWWQSADENSESYDSWRIANVARIGVRLPNKGVISAVSPYVVASSSLSDSGYFWENRLELGGGVRIAPSLTKLPDSWKWFNYLNFYCEAVSAVTYYQGSPPSSVPDHEIRAGITMGFGQWFKVKQ